MKIDFSQKVTDLDGQPVDVTDLPKVILKRENLDLFSEAEQAKYEQVGAHWKLFKNHIKYMTLKSLSIQALSELREEDRSVDQVKKFERGMLAIRIHDSNGECEVTVDELSDLKGLINRVANNVIVAKAFNLIEGAKKSDEEVKPELPTEKPKAVAENSEL